MGRLDAYEDPIFFERQRGCGTWGNTKYLFFNRHGDEVEDTVRGKTVVIRDAASESLGSFQICKLVPRGGSGGGTSGRASGGRGGVGHEDEN